MPTELPIACSLSALNMSKRLAEMSAIGRSAMLDLETSGRSARLRFRHGPGVLPRLEAIVAAEAECCAFLAMRLRIEPDAIELDIDSPAGAEAILGEMVAAFGGSAAQPEETR